jgi:hypothetical protein
MQSILFLIGSDFHPVNRRKKKKENSNIKALSAPSSPLWLNLMMKRGKLFRKLLRNLISHHHHSKNAARAASGIQEYKFFCSNSHAPVFFTRAKAQTPLLPLHQ